MKLHHFGVFLLKINIYNILVFMGEFEQVIAGKQDLKFVENLN